VSVNTGLQREAAKLDPLTLIPSNPTVVQLCLKVGMISSKQYLWLEVKVNGTSGKSGKELAAVRSHTARYQHQVKRLNNVIHHSESKHREWLSAMPQQPKLERQDNVDIPHSSTPDTNQENGINSSMRLRIAVAPSRKMQNPQRDRQSTVSVLVSSEPRFS
jgi:hypothetical protein